MQAQAAVLPLADTYLAKVTDGAPRLHNLNGILGIGRQDRIVQTLAPATLGLFGLGLVALRRKRV